MHDLEQTGATTSRVSLIRRFVLSTSTALLLMLSLWLMVSADSTPLSKTGYLDFSYTGWDGAGTPTGEKQESKLWWNDGFWWGSMFNPATNQFHIYRLNWGTHTWEDSGVALDDRTNSKADVLWDGAANKLYVVSHVAVLSDGEGVSTQSKWARFYRYTYDATLQTYTLDGGFPVTVNKDQTESVVLAKGSTGRLWITYASRAESLHPNADYRIFVNSSGDDGATWGTPFVPTLDNNNQSIHVDRGDISSIVAVNDMVGIMWNNSISQTNQTLHFAVHLANSTSGPWLHRQIPIAEGADDHISLKSLMATGDNKVFAAIKTDAKTSGPISETLPLITMIGVDINSSTVISRQYSLNTDKDTRPMLLLDEGDLSTPSDDKVHIFVTGQETGSKICYKTLNIVTPITSMGQFPSGDCGTSFIEDKKIGYDYINDATSMKKPVNKTTALVVLASDDVATPGGPSRVYVHNQTGNPPPVMTSRQPAPAATSVAMTSVVTVTFSKMMAPATLNASTFSVLDDNSAPVAGSISYDALTRTATFTPDQLLKALTTYTVKLTNGIKDSTNLALNETIDTGPVIEEWSFTTQASMVRFSESSYSVNEVDGAAVVTATLNAPSTDTVTVTVSTSDNTATVAGSDYTASSSALVFAPGEMVKTFAVPVNNDVLPEGNEAFTVTLSAPVNVLLGVPSAASVIIIDDDVTSVQFKPSSVSVAESAGQATMNVSLSKAAAFSVTVDYVSSNGTAVAGGATPDYTSVTGTLTFNPGVLNMTFNVPIVNDTLHENAETINLALSNATPGSVLVSPLGGTAVLTINDDDSVPSVKFSTDAYSVAENSGPAVITVELSNASSSTVTVNYASADDIALAGSDYTAATGTLSFAPGETSKTFNVAINNDALNEPAETLTLKLLSPQNATLSPTSTAQLTILDDDSAPTVQFAAPTFTRGEGGGEATIEVTLSAPSGSLVSVDYATSDGTALEDDDYASASGKLLFAPGETSQVFQVSLLDDILDEENETVNLTLLNPTEATLGGQANATLIIDDNDPAFAKVGFTSADLSVIEDAGTANVAVVLSAARQYNVSVQYNVTNGTATAGSDFTASSGTLTFAAGEITKTLSIPIVNDGTEEDDETILLLLSNPTNATLDSQSTTTLTIVDNDSEPTVQFDAADVEVDEDAGQATVKVSLKFAAPNVVTVDYQTSNGSATAGQDYTATNGTLTFAAGEVTKSITIPITDDSTEEGNETVQLALSNPTNAALGTQATATLTIKDDDGSGLRVGFSKAAYSIIENGGEISIQVELSESSAVQVSVQFGTANGTATSGSDYTATSQTLLFAPGETSKNVVIPILNDTIIEGSETVTLNLTNPSNVALGVQSTAVLTILDDEAGVSVYLPLIKK